MSEKQECPQCKATERDMPYLGNGTYFGPAYDDQGTEVCKHSWHGEPVASPQATRLILTPDEARAADDGAKPVAAQPAAGTTPQAERSGGPLCDNCGKAAKQHYCWADSNPCGVSTYHPSEARAVAPVETRLTAEQFYEEHYDQFLVVGVGSDRHKRVYRFAEAFRDKSEAELQEEIERLAQMHRLVGNDYQYVYGSRHQVQKELAELRVKLTAAEAEAAALRERERWIPVEEKLPNVGERVLISVHGIGANLGHKTRTTGLWNGKDWARGSLEKPIGNTARPIEGTVTHWLNLAMPERAE